VCHPSPIAPADQIATPPPHTGEEPEARPARPTVAEVRAVGQPPGLLDRGGEQWGGRLYMRRISPYVTWAFLRTPITPNGVTWLMTVAGLLAAAALTLPGVVPAVAAVLLLQLQPLFDCSDGELARWRRQRSPAGVYLDGIAHALTEAALPIALGIRADGGWEETGGWTTLGLVAAVLVLLVKVESALVVVARVEAGRPAARDVREIAVPRPSVLRRVRRAFDFVPLFRVLLAVEASLLALVAAIVDAAAGDLVGTRALVVLLVGVATVTVTGHLAAILASDRLR
jgi:phosphatidylglycerophosphate synthase